MSISIMLTLLGKEFRRLLKNLPAMLVLGLMLVLALLLVASNNETNLEVQQTPQVQPSCMIVYWQDDDWIKHLEQKAASGEIPFQRAVRVPIIHVSELEVVNDQPVYRENSCAIEIVRQEDDANKSYLLTYRYSGADKDRLFALANWLLINATWHANNKVHIETRSQPITRVITDEPKSNRPDLQLGDGDRGYMVSTMLVFTTQFFICCALLVSFTSQEKEQGILQAIALTPARMSEIIFAKYTFHMIIALSFSLVIVLLVNRAALMVPALWITNFLTCLGLVSVGAIISSVAPTQTIAGLYMFGYILFNGLVMMLSKEFAAFAVIQAFMFEFYSFIFTFLSLGGHSEQLYVTLRIGLWRMLLEVTLLFALSIYLFRRYSWQAR